MGRSLGVRSLKLAAPALILMCLFPVLLADGSWQDMNRPPQSRLLDLYLPCNPPESTSQSISSPERRATARRRVGGAEKCITGD
ncbi:MAG: hypothetical protein ABS92_03160 [Thiobacillus sp. SCN 63-374]|nr:MAG: hypothetical protein ABS92_03160 [Thiobacillus sp. SCN 63-374]